MLTRKLHDYYAALGDALRTARQKAGMTQGEMARDIGTTQSQVSQMECGTIRAPFDRIAAYAAVVQDELGGSPQVAAIWQAVVAVPLPKGRQLDLLASVGP